MMEFPSAVFPETGFNPKSSLEFVTNTFGLSLCISFAYVLLVHGGRAYMANRPPMDLRRPLLIWSTLLAVFSVMGAIRMTPELVHTLVSRGFKYSVCSFSYFNANRASGFWAFLFTVSKLAELFDTLFIVLRKKKLVFLHWYHHFSVVVFVWYLVSSQGGAGRWFMVMNYCVHSIMYTYYALSAAQIKVPRKLALIITCAQISQMVVGVSFSLIMMHYWWNGTTCDLTGGLIIMSTVIYSSYLVLFLNFFVKSYLKPSAKKVVKEN